jgi:hypothetical protein
MSFSQYNGAPHCLFLNTGLHVCVGLLFRVGKKLGVYNDTAICKYRDEPEIFIMDDWETKFIDRVYDFAQDLIST